MTACARRPRVLFYLNHPSAAVEYLLVADELAPDADVTILSASMPSARGIPPERRGDHRVIDSSGKSLDWTRAEIDHRTVYGEVPPPGWRSALARFAGLPVLGPAGQTALATMRLLRARRAAGAVLDREQAEVLVVAGDRRLFTDTPILVEAKARGIRNVMVPYADGTPYTLVDYRSGMNELLLGRQPHRLAKRLAALSSPRHVHASPAGEMLFYSAADTIAMRLARCSPHMPWVLGASGWIDTVGVLGPADKHYFAEYGLDHRHVHVVGQPSLDRLHKARAAKPALRAALDQRHGFDPARPLIVCSLPQFWTEVESWSKADYRALYDVLLGCEANILCSLHPKMRREDYGELEETPRLRFSDARLVEDLPAADIFVASYSSTLRWSTLLRMPSIIIDFPTYANGRLLNPYPHLPVATDAGMASAWLGAMIAAPAARAQAIAEIEAAAQMTGPFDGQAARRLADLILQAAARRGPSSGSPALPEPDMRSAPVAGARKMV